MDAILSKRNSEVELMVVDYNLISSHCLQV